MGRDLLRLTAIATLLVVTPAFAQDAGPRMYQPPAPEMVGYPNWVLTPDGHSRLTAQLQHDAEEKARLRSENASLRASLVEWEGKPALTWRGALLLVGGGLALGLVIGVPVAAAVRR